MANLILPTHLPEFREGCAYRRLTPKEGDGRWRFITGRGFRLPVKGITNDIICYHDANGKVWARHDKFGVYVEEAYVWNGCSPKRWLWPFGWIGTPDFASTLMASLVHDIHYQFAPTEHFPLHKSDVDTLFRDCIHMAGDPRVARIYHGAVVKYGSWTGKGDTGVFSTLL